MEHKDYKKEYERWLEFSDETTQDELRQIANDENEIKERFSTNLAFGTAGLRGIMSAGTNRINNYTIRRATQGLANYIVENGPSAMARGVAIAFDSRHNSKEYALETGLVLAAHGIKVYLFKELRPTPELSFAVRHKNTIAGIVVTSSHNPRQYNGYKVYWEDGGQLPTSVSDKVIEYINNVDFFETKTTSKKEALSSGLLVYLDDTTDEEYIQAILPQCETGGGDISIVYTPLHGAGNTSIRTALSRAGFGNVTVVPEQEIPDGDFPTVPYPNPEVHSTFDLAISLARHIGAKIILSSDPDADRLGVAYLDHDGEYKFLNGNQTGSLITEYVLSQRSIKGKLPENASVISTIVSTRLTEKICANYNVKYSDVYTGFKHIAEEIAKNPKDNFILGWEESYGYLVGLHARDKDAVVASIVLADLAQWLNAQGKTFTDALENMYKKYGYHNEGVLNIVREGLSGAAEIIDFMNSMRVNIPKTIGRFKVNAFRDYQNNQRYDFENTKEEELNMSPADVVYLELDENLEIAVRPSGTEPKIKFYFFATDKNPSSAQEKIDVATSEMQHLFEERTQSF